MSCCSGLSPARPPRPGGNASSLPAQWTCATCRSSRWWAVSTDRLRITGWQDDPVDFGDTRWATRWDLSTPAPDARLGGAINTVQTRTVWATPDAAEWFGGYGPSVLQWSAFVPPAANLTRDGVWLPEATWEKHLQVRTVHDWREWIR
jgi:hypothetical protein